MASLWLRRIDAVLQLMFSIKPILQTVVFVGYSDNYQGYTDVNLTKLDRTYFVMLGYAQIR